MYDKIRQTCDEENEEEDDELYEDMDVNADGEEMPEKDHE